MTHADAQELIAQVACIGYCMGWIMVAAVCMFLFKNMSGK